MKKVVSAFMLIISLMVLVSCEKQGNITAVGHGSSTSGDVNLLKGEWNFESFAYTADGTEIITKEQINKGFIRFTADYIFLYFNNKAEFSYTINKTNKISVNLETITKRGGTEEDIRMEMMFSDAFEHMSSYEIKDNKLFLHYAEKDNKNVLVLNKR